MRKPKGYYTGKAAFDRQWRKAMEECGMSSRCQVGRPRTRYLTWRKVILSHGFKDVPDGVECDVTPQPGRTYTRYTWPPRGRGRGESLTSPRRIAAKQRAAQVIALRARGYTWQEIANQIGYADASGAYRAWQRSVDRIDFDRRQREQARKKKRRA